MSRKKHKRQTPRLSFASVASISAPAIETASKFFRVLTWAGWLLLLLFVGLCLVVWTLMLVFE